MYNQDIVRKVMAGDLDAFSKMYNDCAPAIYRRAYSLLDDPVLARETVRNVFRDIRKHIQALPDPKDFDEWVFRLVNMHVNKLKGDRQQLWDEPDLRGVWDEINAEETPSQSVQTPETIIETLARMRRDDERQRNATPPVQEGAKEESPAFPPSFQQPLSGDASLFSSPGGAEEWEPILFPPEEGGGRGAADLALEGVPPSSQDAFAAKPLSSPGPDTAQESEAAQSGEEEVLLPLNQDPSKKTGARKRRRIRYEAARANTHFSVERVPYDYIPYEESSQEAYERVAMEETPRAVYEHIPYERPAKEDLVNITKPDVSYTTVPYQSEAKEDLVMYDSPAVAYHPISAETGTIIDGAEPPISQMDRSSPASSIEKGPHTPADNADLLSQQWQDVPLDDLDVDQVLQDIVAEVDGVQIEQRGQSIIEEPSAPDHVQVSEKDAPAAAIRPQTVQNDAEEASTVSVESAPPQHVEREITEQPSFSVIPGDVLEQGSVEIAPRVEADVDQAIVDPQSGSGSMPDALTEQEASPLPEDATAEPEPKKRSWLAGAGFFASAVVILVGILLLGHYLGLW